MILQSYLMVQRCPTFWRTLILKRMLGRWYQILSEEVILMSMSITPWELLLLALTCGMEFGNGLVLKLKLALGSLKVAVEVAVEISQDIGLLITKNGRHLLETLCMDSSSLPTLYQKEPHY